MVGVLTNESIVFDVEDRPKRFFNEWYSSVINQDKKAQVESVTDDNCKNIAFDLATGLLEIGTGLQSELQTGELELTR